MKDRPRRYVDALLAALGPQGWWPGDTPFEVCVGAILTQNTAWKNVEKAIANLKSAGALSLDAIAAMPIPRLEELIRPAGTFRVKAKRLSRFCRWAKDERGGLDVLFSLGSGALREALLEVPGIGPETADSIALYAAGKPTFVADTYTHRIAARHGLLDWEAGYDDVREYFQGALPDDPQVLNEAHALFVKVGKDWCRSKPKCDACPLKEFLPEFGPREKPQW